MRNIGLDVVRLAAVLLVLGNHMTLPLPIHDIPDVASVMLKAWQEGGWVGVDLFFVVSGYLVLGLLFKEHLGHGRVNVGKFLIRRGLKIYPAFWVLLGCTVIYYIVTGVELRWHRVASELLFIQNYFGPVWYHTWSLAVEEHFYIALALLVWCLSRTGGDRMHWIPNIFFVVAAACLSMRLLTQYIYPDYVFSRWLAPTHLRADALMFGVYLSYLAHYHGLHEKLACVRSSLLSGLGVTLLLPAFIFPRGEHAAVSSVGLVSFYLGSGAVVLASTRLSTTRSISLKWAAVLGAASYSTYLWHVVANPLAETISAGIAGPAGYLLYFSLYVGGAFVLGQVMAKCVEVPVLRLRDRFFVSGAKTNTAPGIPLPATLPRPAI